MARQRGEPRSYAVMWKKYKRRVLLAMSSQAFAQLVSLTAVRSNMISDYFVEWDKRYVIPCLRTF